MVSVDGTDKLQLPPIGLFVRMNCVIHVLLFKLRRICAEPFKIPSP